MKVESYGEYSSEKGSTVADKRRPVHTNNSTEQDLETVLTSYGNCSCFEGVWGRGRGLKRK